MGYLNVERLEPGMILNDDVINSRYRVPLAKKGVLITPELIRKFISHGISVINIHHPQEVAEQIVDETSMVLADLFENFNNISQKDYARLLPYIDEIVATIKKFGREIVDELFLLWRMDQYTFHHSVGTAFYSGLIAQELGYSDRELHELVLGSILHDIGKGAISLKILNKPGMLEPSEFMEIKKHSYLGYKVLEETSDFSDNIKRIPLQHHERIDGTGYPYQLKGNQIHEYAQIVSIADCFSALTTNRPYRDKVSKFVAAEYILASAGVGLDKYLTNIFLYAIFGNLTDTWVELNNGEIGRVVALNYQYPTRPKLAIYYGKKYIKEIDLSVNLDIYIKDFYKEEAI